MTPSLRSSRSNPTRLVAATIAVLSCSHAADAQSVQTRDAAIAARARGTAVLAGTVTSQDESSRPVRRVLVTLSGAGVPAALQVVTDDAGGFVFAQLPAGRYTLTAEKPGHVKTYHGSRRAGGGPATPIALGEGQRITSVAIELLRGAAIEGTVLDENGVPLSSAQVTALRPFTVNGERKLVRPPGTMQWATSDDRGRYRLYGLPPGEYTVRAVGGGSLTGGTRLTTPSGIDGALQGATPGSARNVSETIAGPQVGRSGVYYPGVADAASAEFFRLAPAEERTGVDIRNPVVRTSRLEGTAVGPDGQPLRNVLVGLANLSTGSLWGSLGIVRPQVDGRFSIASITPGRYAFFGRGTREDVSATPDVTLPLWTWTEVLVDEQDVVDVAMQFLPGVSIAGRLVFRGSGPPLAVTRLRLSLVQVPSIAAAAVSLPPVVPAADGTFVFKGVPPGRYRVAVTGAAGWALRSATVNGIDVLDTPLEVLPGQDVPHVTVSLTDRPAEISGTLFDELGRPAPEYAVVVFSTDRAHWASAPRRTSGVVKLGSDGRFHVSGLPPGEYFLTALADLDPAELGDAVVLEQLAAASLKLTLAEGERKVQDFKISAAR